MAASEGGYPIHLHRNLVALPKKQNSRVDNLIDLQSNIDEQDTITEKSNCHIREMVAKKQTAACGKAAFSAAGQDDFDTLPTNRTINDQIRS